jgi:predicted  nucleic acid-binding Zn-ribbon protein
MATSQPNPVQQLASEISALQSKLSDLQEGARLRRARDTVEDLQTKVNGMSQRIASLRQRGYVFEKGLEEQAADFVKQWQVLLPSVQQQINVQSAQLQAALRPIEAQMTQLGGLRNNPMAARPLVASLKAAVDTLQGQVRAAERTIEGMYDRFNTQVSQTDQHLTDIDRLLTDLAEASFQLLPTEAGIASVKAVWCKTGKEQKGDPEGILFLTDQRLIFEQKEQVTTKRVLFVATEKEKVQALQWEVPVALVDKIQTSKQGLLKNEDHIEIRFVSGAPREMVHLHIWESCDQWQALINRAKAKDFDKDRAVAIDESAADKVRSAPSQCPSCGANISQVILRGQDTLKCEYCGYVIRL